MKKWIKEEEKNIQTIYLTNTVDWLTFWSIQMYQIDLCIKIKRRTNDQNTLYIDLLELKDLLRVWIFFFFFAKSQNQIWKGSEITTHHAPRSTLHLPSFKQLNRLFLSFPSTVHLTTFFNVFFFFQVTRKEKKTTIVQFKKQLRLRQRRKN